MSAAPPPAQRAATHSEKGLQTLRLMGFASTEGWTTPPVRWDRVTRTLPTYEPCTTCHRLGQVADPDARATAGAAETPAERRRLEHAMRRCPTCAGTRRHQPECGTGEMLVWKPRVVLVGTILWPEGTRFDSRFGGGNQCGLCAKAITKFCPVMARDPSGTWHGLFVGEDCLRSLLRGAEAGLPMDVAEAAAAAGKATMRLMREIPKPPRVAKPKPPALEHPATRAELDAVVAETFGPAATERPWYSARRTELSYTFYLRRQGTDRVTGYEVKVSARNGVTVRVSYGTEKPFVKDRDRRDAVSALRDAVPAIRAHAGLAPA